MINCRGSINIGVIRRRKYEYLASKQKEKKRKDKVIRRERTGERKRGSRSIYMRSPFIVGVQGWSRLCTRTQSYDLMGNLNKYDIKTAEGRCRRRVTGRASRPLSNQEEGKKNSRQPRPDTHTGH